MSETEVAESQNPTTDEASQADKFFGSEVPESTTEQESAPEQESHEGQPNEETQEKLLSEGEDRDGERSEQSDQEEGEDTSGPIELTLPEEARIDEAALTTVKEFAEKHSLTGEVAQATLELADTAVKNFEQQSLQSWNEDRDRDAARVRQDPEFGGSKFDQSEQYALTAIKRFNPDPEGYVKKLKDSRMSDDYDHFIMLARIGKLLSEDTFRSGTPKGGERDNSPDAVANRLFGQKS